MAKVTVPIIGSSQDGMDTPTPTTLALRDSSGGLACNVLTATSVNATNWVGTVASKTANFTLGAATTYFCNATGGAFTATLPTPASAFTGVEYRIIKTDSSGNAITVGTVSGTTSISTQYHYVTVISDGSNWYSI